MNLEPSKATQQNKERGVPLIPLPEVDDNLVQPPIFSGRPFLKRIKLESNHPISLP